MKNTLKPLGWLAISILPMLAFVLIQTAALSMVAIVEAVRIMLGSGAGTQDYGDLADILTQSLTDSIGPGIFLSHLLSVLVFGLWYYLIDVRPQRKLKKSAVKLGKAVWGWSLLLGLGLSVFGTMLVLLGEHFFPDMLAEYHEMLEASFGESALAIIAAVLLAPIGEEFLCRGVIQHYAMKVSKRFFVVNIIQALMFAIMHWNWVQGTYVFFIGLVLGWLKYRHKSLWPPIFVHFIINISSFTWMAYTLEQLPEQLAMYALLLLLSVAGMAAILWRIGREDKAVSSVGADAHIGPL